MPYRVELFESSRGRPHLVWEIGDDIVRREQLEDAPTLTTYIVHTLRLGADPRDIGQCAEQVVRERSAVLRVRMLGDPTPPIDPELARLRGRCQQLEQQAARNRDDIVNLKKENDGLLRRAADADARATQAAQAERAARQAAAQQVAAAQKHAEALQAQLARADSSARIALQEAGTLRSRLQEVEDDLTLLRRRLADQTRNTEERRLT